MIITSILSSHDNEPRLKGSAFEDFPEIVDTLIDGVWATALDSTLEQMKTARSVSKKKAA